ncbi:MAG TPA: hypothetical protein VK760_15605 [Candidatus Acidoferrales bacterium]|jgi:hypothetical protein|nr:hypothetical protein [Candidatus Acidoferrales bacterium]
MLKVGDRVYVDATNEEGTVKEVHPHKIVVRVATATGHEERGYSVEDLRLDPTMSEASNFIDH